MRSLSALLIAAQISVGAVSAASLPAGLPVGIPTIIYALTAKETPKPQTVLPDQEFEAFDFDLYSRGYAAEDAIIKGMSFYINGTINPASLATVRLYDLDLKENISSPIPVDLSGNVNFKGLNLKVNKQKKRIALNVKIGPAEVSTPDSFFGFSLDTIEAQGLSSTNSLSLQKGKIFASNLFTVVGAKLAIAKSADQPPSTLNPGFKQKVFKFQLQSKPNTVKVSQVVFQYNYSGPDILKALYLQDGPGKDLGKSTIATVSPGVGTATFDLADNLYVFPEQISYVTVLADLPVKGSQPSVFSFSVKEITGFNQLTGLKVTVEGSAIGNTMVVGF